MIETNELVTKFTFKGSTKPLEAYNDNLQDVSSSYKKTGDNFLALTKKFAIGTIVIGALKKGIDVLGDYKNLHNKSEFFGVNPSQIQALNILGGKYTPDGNFGDKLIGRLNQLQVGQFDTKGSPQLYELMANMNKTGTVTTPEILQGLIEMMKTIPDGKDAAQMAKTIGQRILGNAEQGYVLYKLIKDGQIKSTTKALAKGEEVRKTNVEGFGKTEAVVKEDITKAKNLAVGKGTVLQGDGEISTLAVNSVKAIVLKTVKNMLSNDNNLFAPLQFWKNPPNATEQKPSQTNNTTNIEQNNTINVDSTKEASQFIKQNADNATGIAKDVSQ